MTDKEIGEMITNGTPSHTFDNTGDYHRAMEILHVAKRKWREEHPGNARYWPTFAISKEAENALDCKMCECKTQNVFNIGFQAMPLCEGCAASITLQQVKFYVMGGS